jgi:para-nitrobenzyl esterase
MPRRRDLLALASGLALTGGWALRPAPRVTTQHGPVIGDWDGPVAVFRGLRYGRDTRLDRLAPPRPPEPWITPVEATAYGPSCPQTGSESGTSEDCLFLNVWSPGLDDDRRPVLVYIHGGAYATGSGSDPLYDGTRLARRRDAVVVTLNHRLGPLGYAYLARLAHGFEASGNTGQLDLVLALAWVRDNIARFGGDPGRVTVFGQSGGGAKIATLMAMPGTAGLFHRALTMSGQQVTASGPINATRRATAWLEGLGLAPAEAAAVRDLPVERLVEAARRTDPVLGYGGLYFGPVLDGTALPRHPFYPDAPPQSAHVPMIIGQTADETLAFLGNDPRNAGLTWETLPQRLTPDQLRTDVAPEAVIAAYRRMRPDLSPDQVLIAATTAGRSWRAALIELELRAAQEAPTWAYQLDLPARLPNGRTGAYHTADIPLMFDNIDAPGSGYAASGEAQGLADALGETLVAFARDGAPPGQGPLGPWPQYRLPDRATMILDRTPRVVHDPRGDERRFFARIPYIQPGT